MKEFCGEILYDTPEGGVHSDICHHNDDQPLVMVTASTCMIPWMSGSTSPTVPVPSGSVTLITSTVGKRTNNERTTYAMSHL